MKFTIPFLSLLTFLTFSCTKVIDLDLKSSETLYVLEAEVNAGDSIHRLKISQTIPFDQVNVFPEIVGAIIVLQDNQGNSTTYNDLGNGMYETPVFFAFEGRTYTVTVKIDDKEFVASSTIPGKVTLLGATYQSAAFFGDTGVLITPTFTDPAGIANYYRFNYFKPSNPEDNAGFILSNDDISDGQANQQPFIGSYFAQSGDTLLYQMWGIDENVYKYYFSREVNTSGNAGAPANPVTNWSNNALGYFTAQVYQEITLIIP